MITVGGLFSGIGGFELGLQRAGMQIKWMVEIDPFCLRVLAKHWPNVERYEDVRECGKHNLETVDLVCGGFPCQPHSVAGKRRGAADDRNLWPEYRRIITEMRPRWVIGENVLGIRTTILDEVLSDLESLAYATGTLVIPACAFDAPHRRERVFVVAHANSDRCNKHRVGEIHANEAGQSSQFELTGRSQSMAHAPCQLCDGGDDNGVCRPEQVSKSGNRTKETRPISSGWTAEPGVGMLADGFPARLARLGWLPEPPIGRVATGIPDVVVKLKALGNAVVPQITEWIGQQILYHEHGARYV